MGLILKFIRLNQYYIIISWKNIKLIYYINNLVKFNFLIISDGRRYR